MTSSGERSQRLLHIQTLVFKQGLMVSLLFLGFGGHGTIDDLFWIILFSGERGAFLSCAGLAYKGGNGEALIWELFYFAPPPFEVCSFEIIPPPPQKKHYQT